MLKLKRSPKNIELDINAESNGQLCVFPWQKANSVAQHEYPHTTEYC